MGPDHGPYYAEPRPRKGEPDKEIQVLSPHGARMAVKTVSTRRFCGSVGFFRFFAATGNEKEEGEQRKRRDRGRKGRRKKKEEESEGKKGVTGTRQRSTATQCHSQYPVWLTFARCRS